MKVRVKRYSSLSIAKHRKRLNFQICRFFLENHWNVYIDKAQWSQKEHGAEQELTILLHTITARLAATCLGAPHRHWRIEDSPHPNRVRWWEVISPIRRPLWRYILMAATRLQIFSQHLMQRMVLLLRRRMSGNVRFLFHKTVSNEDTWPPAHYTMLTQAVG